METLTFQNQISQDKVDTLTKQAKFVRLGSTLPSTQEEYRKYELKTWYSECRHSWDRSIRNKNVKLCDLNNKDLTFSLKNRVCGLESEVKSYLKCSFIRERPSELVTYEKYLNGEIDMEEEIARSKRALSTAKPTYTEEELSYLIENKALWRRVKRSSLLGTEKGDRSSALSKKRTSGGRNYASADRQRLRASSCPPLSKIELASDRLRAKYATLDRSNCALNVVKPPCTGAGICSRT